MANRTVIVWPDADTPGLEAMHKLLPRLPTNTQTVRVDDVAEGFDAADLEQQDCDDPDAWLRERLQPVISNAITDHGFAGLCEHLLVSTWLAREQPPPDRLLGDLITTTSRVFLVGPTGLDKTTLGMAFATGIGFGIGFLHWRASRPARVLLIDGEMPAELLVQRLRDAARRIACEDRTHNVTMFSLEDVEDIAERWPQLGMFEPLNTKAGTEFIKRLTGELKPDVVIFDNVQALLVGVQKEEEAWIPVLPLVQWLTKQRVGQLWIDHTARTTGAQYGSSVKAWRFDTVAIMSPLDEHEREPRETPFVVSFEKAQRRTPDNWKEFEPHIIRLREDVWTGEPVEKHGRGGQRLGKVAPSCKVFHDALLGAIAHMGGPRPGETTDAAWRDACIHRDLIKPSRPDDTKQDRAAADRDYRKANRICKPRTSRSMGSG